MRSGRPKRERTGNNKFGFGQGNIGLKKGEKEVFVRKSIIGRKSCGVCCRWLVPAILCLIFLSGNVAVSGELSTANGDFPAGQTTEWTVPDGVAQVSILAAGAKGGHDNGGKGALIGGDFSVTPGTTLKILVGARGECDDTAFYLAGGGGGGSFVWDANNPSVPIVVAGGGGGGNQDYLGGCGGAVGAAAGDGQSYSGENTFGKGADGSTGGDGSSDYESAGGGGGGATPGADGTPDTGSVVGETGGSILTGGGGGDSNGDAGGGGAGWGAGAYAEGGGAGGTGANAGGYGGGGAGGTYGGGGGGGYGGGGAGAS